MKRMSDKQERFCLEYVVDGNASRAYMAAYPAVRKMKTAAVNGKRLLRDCANVKARVAELQAEIAERCKLRAEHVVEELRALGFWSIQDFVGEGNLVNDLSKMDRDTLKPVVGIKVKTETLKLPGYDAGQLVQVTTELKLADKRGALVDLGRHLGIFEQDNNQKAIKIKVTRK